MLKVYGRANSINVRKVLWMLDELGVEYEREDWGRGFKPKPAFKAVSACYERLSQLPAYKAHGRNGTP